MERYVEKSLGDALLNEIMRVNDDVIPPYAGAKQLAAQTLLQMQRDISEAEQALAKGDSVTMARAYLTLKKHRFRSIG
jgi:hypothetical protein